MAILYFESFCLHSFSNKLNILRKDKHFFFILGTSPDILCVLVQRIFKFIMDNHSHLPKNIAHALNDAVKKLHPFFYFLKNEAVFMCVRIYFQSAILCIVKALQLDKGFIALQNIPGFTRF